MLIAVAAYVTVRRTPPAVRGGIVRLRKPLRTGLAAILDVCIVASVVLGLITAGRPLFGSGFASQWFDIALPMLVTLILYVVIARRSAGGTLGEALLNISYLRRRKTVDAITG